MIGSTAQQFLTFLSHRGEETGNIRGSMKVRVPTERLGTRERLYGGGSTGRVLGHEVGGVGRSRRGGPEVWEGHIGIPGIFGSFVATAGNRPALRSSWQRKGLAGLRAVCGIEDPRSPLSLLPLPPLEWISIDKDEAGAKSKNPSMSRGSQEPR